MNHRIYDDILNNIVNVDIKKFTIQCLIDAPTFLETVPASISGKYHPVECCQRGGLVRHVQRACWFGHMFIKSNNWSERDIRADILLSALLLHDTGKKEKYIGSEYMRHASIAVEQCSKNKNLVPEKIYNIIANCILHHMGPWTEKSIAKPLETYTLLQLLTYEADYLASQKTLELC